MTLTFGLTIPLGPVFEPSVASTLRSLAAQGSGVRVALCDVSDDPRLHALADEFADIIAYRRHGPDAGQADAIKEGWHALDADVFGWLNADDCLAPGALDRVRGAFDRDAGLGVFYGQSLIADEARGIIGLHPAIRPPSPRLYRDDIVSQPSCFVRRAAYERVGGVNPDLHYVMDWDLWCRLYENGARFQHTDDVLSYVVWAEATKTASFFGPRLREIDRVLRQRNGPVARAKSVFGFAQFHLRQYGGGSSAMATGDPWRVGPGDRVDLPFFAYERAEGLVAELSNGTATLAIDGAEASGERPALRTPIDAGRTVRVTVTGERIGERLRALRPIIGSD